MKAAQRNGGGSGFTQSPLDHLCYRLFNNFFGRIICHVTVSYLKVICKIFKPYLKGLSNTGNYRNTKFTHIFFLRCEVGKNTKHHDKMMVSEVIPFQNKHEQIRTFLQKTKTTGHVCCSMLFSVKKHE